MASTVNKLRSVKRARVGHLTALFGLGVVAAAVNGCQAPLPPPKEPTPQPCPEQAPITPQCVLWSRAQEPLAKLGLEALKLGRIDAGLYEVDPQTKLLRVSPGVPGDTSALSRALDDLNRQLVTRDALETSFRRASSPEHLTKCPAKTYAVRVFQDPKAPEKEQKYHWEFTGDKPGQEELRECFQALYATPPEGCKLAPSVYADQRCLQLKGLNPEEVQTEARAAQKAFHVEAAMHCGTCNICGVDYLYKPGTQLCGNC